MNASQIISKNQFEAIESAFKDITAFLKEDLLPTMDTDGQPEEKVITILKIAAARDLVICYNGLGIGVNFKRPESIALLILFSKDTLGDRMALGESITYDELDTIFYIYDQIVDKTLILYNNLLTNKSIHGILGALQNRQKSDLLSKYVILLYRFTSLIAKIDGEVTPQEVNWLNTIMSWKGDSASAVNENLTETGLMLDGMIGLESVKQQVRTLRNYIMIQQERSKNGMKSTPVSYHCVFLGNPGTGKTTVARIIAQIYKELGVLKSGHLVETDRSGLVAEYVGQTAVKTNKIIDSALDGILFIDEAYALVDGNNNDYGKEAIATLIKRMEDDRDRLVVILAGYKDEMGRFLNSNPGIQSRFSRIIEFPDYSADELFQIFEINCKRFEYSMSEAFIIKLKELFNNAILHKDKNFGNARYVRNLFEKTIENQANRLSRLGSLTKEMLSMIEAEDLEQYNI